jgi:hypothetical protein
MIKEAYKYFILTIITMPILSDNINYNTYNNHGIVGLINMPTARFYDESSHGITLFSGTPDTKLTFSSNPFNWLEASFFYASIDGKPYPGSGFTQDYKDKGFNFKFRLFNETRVFPSIAIGINDIGGTGLYSSEYIVSSYGINNIDFHFGLGWGNLSGGSTIKNPLGYFYDGFKNRPKYDPNEDISSATGNFNFGTFFSGKEVSPFFGISYAYNEKLLLKLEQDTIVVDGQIEYKEKKSQISFGLDYKVSNNLSIGLSFERGSNATVKFLYKNKASSVKPYEYKKQTTKSKDKNTNLIKNLEANGIGVNKIYEGAKSIGLELTQFSYPNKNLIDEIISFAKKDAGIEKDVITNLKIADLDAVIEYGDDFEKNSRLIYERKSERKFNSNTKFVFRPFLASREEFFKGAILVENNNEYIIRDNFFFSSNLKYSLADNFDDFRFQPVDTYPAQVRSDVKDYLKNIDNGLIIGRAQLDLHFSPFKHHHIMFTGGILEDMFSGIGMEYLYFRHDKNFAIGFEAFGVVKRDYRMRFGTLDYRNTTGHINFYHRNYNYIPFDTKVSYGEYLAGDSGLTIELSRTFENGTKFGVFASFTDVTSEQFGEGSFDKGIFFNIPIYGNFINYTWKPLTKDPGAKLNRKNTLYDLLVKFKPINN